MSIQIIFILAILSPAVFAKPLNFASGETQNTVIELYTSEGCSSCPPAERWISNMKGHPKLFSEIIPLAFHVDYWNYLGWRDKFANAEYSQRQQQHYRESNVSQVYTPGVLKNGNEYRQWSRGQVYASGANVGKLEVKVIDETVNIEFHPQQPNGRLVAHVTLLGFGFKSQVSAGENVGKTLIQDFVVLQHSTEISSINRWSMALPSSSLQAEKYAIAVWISRTNSSKPIQATASWL